MSSQPLQLDLFEKVEEIVYLYSELEQLLEEGSHLMLAIDNRHNDLSKSYLSLKSEHEQLQERLTQLENELTNNSSTFMSSAVEGETHRRSSKSKGSGSSETQLTLSF